MDNKINEIREVFGGFVMLCLTIGIAIYCYMEFNNSIEVREEARQIHKLESEQQDLKRKLEIKRLEQENSQLKLLLQE